MIRRVSYLYHMTRDEVLLLTINQLMAYLEDGYYWKLDELGVEYKRPLSEEEIEIQKEKDARKQAQYDRILKKRNK